MEENKYLKRKEKALNGNKEQLATACQHLGSFYNQQGRYQDAVKEYEQEAQLYAALGKKLEMARALRMVGEMCVLLTDFEKGREHINDYLKIAKQLKNKVEEQRAYTTLGRAHLLHGQTLSDTSASHAMTQFREAEKAFIKSLLLAKELTGQISKIEQLDMQARCYLNIGVVKEQMEEFDDAVANIEKALKVSEKHDIFELSHTCYISMSLLYHVKRNDSRTALRYCNKALDIAKRFNQKVKKICETLIIKSEILIKAGDFASAKQILTKAYKKNTPDENDRITIEKSLRVVAKICQILDELINTSSIDYAKRKALFEKLGDGCCHLGNYTKALEYYHNTLECAQLNKDTENDLIPIYVSLYQTYKDNKQYDLALEYLWKEYDLNKNVHNEAFLTLCSIAEICELQKQSFWTIQDIYQKAKSHAEKAEKDKMKLEKVAYERLRKLHVNHNMNILAEELVEEAKSKGIDLSSVDDESDSDSDGASACENNTPDLGEDICLDDLTDSDTSDLDETEKPRPHRATRGVRSLTIKRNNKGETQLHQACIAGNIELVRRLIDQGHVVNVRDHAGWLPLHEASNHGFRDIVQLLLDRGAAVAINDKGGTSCDGITPLYDACSNGYLDVVELLLERGADATVKTDFGDTCLSGLDKWRRSATLTEGEQVEYEQIRAQLVRTLSKVGIFSNQVTEPLTNAKTAFAQNLKAHAPEDSRSFVETETATFEQESDEIVRPSVSRLNRSREKPKTRSPASASMEYKNAIEQLKHPHHRKHFLDSDDDDAHYGGDSGKKRSAYLNAEEVDEDSWLVDDLGPDRKKRRFQTTPTHTSRSTSSIAKTNIKSPYKEKHNQHSLDSGNASWLRDSLTPENDAFQLLLEASGTSSQQRQKQTKKLSLSRSSSISSNASIATISQRHKPKHQSSLLDSGFCRFRSESPHIGSDDSNEAQNTVNVRSTEPDSTTSIQLLISPAKLSPIKVQTTPFTLSTTVSFKVKVEDELLLVPIERKKLSDINIRWLAEEASRRYYNLVGLKPLLRLKTADGFAYEENDPVNVAFEQNMILATVLEWQISPLGQRYEEMCLQLHKAVNSEVQDVLQRAQISNAISLSDFWLTPQQTTPIFKAILHQNILRILDLSNNFIKNDGCRQLAKSLPTLKQLKILNLKGNCITADGLDALLSCPGIEKLAELEDLILSQNPLGNTCLRTLDRFCNSSSGKSLQKLHLSQCQLTNLYEYDLGFYRLVDFDISFNQLNDDSIRNLLQKLNSCRLQNLNLSYIKKEQSSVERTNSLLADKFSEFFESGTCEKFKNIELVGCQLVDVNIYKIVQCLSRANDLELLNISNNGRITNSSLHFILDKLPQLRKLVAINCTNLVDREKLDRLANSKQIPNFMAITLTSCDLSTLSENLSKLWHLHWGDRGKMMTYGNNYVLYTNEKDLIGVQ